MQPKRRFRSLSERCFTKLSKRTLSSKKKKERSTIWLEEFSFRIWILLSFCTRRRIKRLSRSSRLILMGMRWLSSLSKLSRFCIRSCRFWFLSWNRPILKPRELWRKLKLKKKRLINYKKFCPKKRKSWELRLREPKRFRMSVRDKLTRFNQSLTEPWRLLITLRNKTWMI